MGVISYIKEEIKVVKERDPAIKSDHTERCNQGIYDRCHITLGDQIAGGIEIHR